MQRSFEQNSCIILNPLSSGAREARMADTVTAQMFEYKCGM